MIASGVNFRPVDACQGLYRSGDLAAVTPADAALLVEVHGVRRVVDLRSEREVRDGGRPEALIGAGAEWAWCPLRGADEPFRRTPLPGTHDYFALYARMLAAEGDQIRSAVATLAQCGGTRAVFGCSAGKDRTGILAALVLGLAGAPVETIAADYALTREHIAPSAWRFRAHWERKGLTQAEYMLRFTCAPETMVLLCEHVDARYGGWEPYAATIGTSALEIDALRRSFPLSSRSS